MPKFIKIFTASVIFSLSAALFSLAQAANIEVDFSNRLERNMGSLNQIEQEREKFFRETADDVSSTLGRSDRFFNIARHANVPWAGETLVPDLSQFTVEFFFKQMASETLKRAGMENLEGTIRFTINTMKVANHSLNFLRSNDSYIVGTIEHIGANGQVLASKKVSANLVYDTSVDNNYDGNDFAFYRTDLVDRVGPTLSRFIQKGLEVLFEDKDFNGPIIIG